MAEDSADFYVRFVPKEGQPAIVGECTDELHPGKEYPRPPGGYPKDYRGQDVVFGWFQVTSFTFGFDVKIPDESGQTATPTPPAAGTAGRPATPGAGTGGNAARTPPARQASSQDSEDYNRPEVSIAKKLDAASTSFWLNNCYQGQELARVEAEACRSGGREGTVKTPFVRLVFEDVSISSISMSLPDNALPTETLQFKYKKVQMESIWTGNETGERKVGRPRTFGWNFETNNGWSAD
jgi:type VI protein secretion system component Hcp